MSKAAYGIDFGTTNTSVAWVNASGKAEVLKLDSDSKNPFILRSVIYISRDVEFSFGLRAVENYNFDVANAKAAKKKIIRTGKLIKITSDATGTSGYKPDKIVEQVFEAYQTDSGRLLQSIKSLLGNQSLEKLQVFGKEYQIEELVAIFLREVKKRADGQTGLDVKSLVLGRPVQFVGNNQLLAKKRLIKAAKLAGFENVKLQLEPIGAAYDFGVNISDDKTILVFDFGGGTLDLSVVKFPEKKILNNSGIPLGGDLINSNLFLEKLADFFGRGETYGANNARMPESLYLKLKNWYTISLLKTQDFADSLENMYFNHSNDQSLENLRSLVFENLGFSLYEEVDRVKKALSENDKNHFKFKTGSSEIVKEIYRKEFEKIIKDDLDEINKLIDEALKKARLTQNDVDLLAATGGSSLIPAVRKLLIDRFGRSKLKDKDTFTSVASGLALYAKQTFR